MDSIKLDLGVLGLRPTKQRTLAKVPGSRACRVVSKVCLPRSSEVVADDSHPAPGHPSTGLCQRMPPVFRESCSGSITFVYSSLGLRIIGVAGEMVYHRGDSRGFDLLGIRERFVSGKVGR